MSIVLLDTRSKICAHKTLEWNICGCVFVLAWIFVTKDSKWAEFVDVTVNKWDN